MGDSFIAELLLLRQKLKDKVNCEEQDKIYLAKILQ